MIYTITCTINKSSYHKKLIKDGKLRMGVLDSFFVILFQKLDDIIKNIKTSINDLEKKFNWIENNGYTGTCPAFNQLIIQNGIVVGCN